MPYPFPYKKNMYTSSSVFQTPHTHKHTHTHTHTHLTLLEQTYICLYDHSANVHTVTNAVQSKRGADFIGDGLEVDDSSGTQGKDFIIILS